MKLMAIDYGSKRVGIASTDESGEFALPREVLPNDASLLEKIVEFYKKEGIETVVIGESKNFKGEPNSIMGEVYKLKMDLESLGIPTVFHTEVLTTMEARQIQGQTEMTDASAASLILKNYLDTMYNREQ